MSTIYDKEAMLCQLDETFSELKSYIHESVGNQEIYEVEKTVFGKLQQLGQSMLQLFINESGTGYEAGNPPLCAEGQAMKYKGIVESPYYSIFGELRIRRAGYASSKGGYLYPLDAKLNLPTSKYSYLLQKWIEAWVTESDFRTAVERFNEIFDFSFSPQMPQRLAGTISEQVDPFYDQIEAPPEETEGSHLVISADSKGVRLLRSERSNSQQELTKTRLGKGKKRVIKKDAVVTADFSFNPHPRTPEEILKALLNQYSAKERQEAQFQLQKRQQRGLEKPRAPLNKHVRASLDGKAVAFSYLCKRLHKRDPSGEKKLIALLDGDPYLEDMLSTQLKAHNCHDRLDALILDIIHVSEYIWDVATALHGEKNPQRLSWVEDKLLAILNSKVARVSGGLKQTLTKSKLTKAQKNSLMKAITYFDNHRHMMDYATYLQKGYPIATGLIEGTCGSLVKDRMEQSGMRWSLSGAKAVLHLRAVMKNDDWHNFWEFYIDSERDRLHPDFFQKAA